jgi:hypothetical protein
MSTYALVFNGAIVQIDPATFPVNPALSWTGDISAVTPAPQVGWAATETGGVWTFTAPPAPPAPTLAQQAAAAMSAGLAITSTSTPALNATYDVGTSAQNHMQAEMISLLASGGALFADGTATVAWPDMMGAIHTFTAAEAKAFFLAAGAYVAALFKVQNGTLTTLPAATATIA